MTLVEKKGIRFSFLITAAEKRETHTTKGEMKKMGIAFGVFSVVMVTIVDITFKAVELAVKLICVLVKVLAKVIWFLLDWGIISRISCKRHFDEVCPEKLIKDAHTEIPKGVDHKTEFAYRQKRNMATNTIAYRYVCYCGKTHTYWSKKRMYNKIMASVDLSGKIQPPEKRVAAAEPATQKG